jgi:hypothetical protein
VRAARKPVPAPAVDPALRPFLDALAELLAADQARTEEARRALRGALGPPRLVKRARQ